MKTPNQSTHFGMCRLLTMIGWTMLAGNLIAQSGLINFETLPDGSEPAEGLAISNQFLVPFGISFVFEDGTYPLIAKIGSSSPSAFKYQGLDNNPAPGQNLGHYLLTDDGVIDVPPPPLVVSFASPVAAASGVVIDIDGNPTEHYEAWDIFARDVNSNVIASVHLSTNSPNAGDGKAAPWSIQRPTPDISSIRIAYSTANGRTSRVGLAFDNLSTFAQTPPLLSMARVPAGLRIGLAGMFGTTHQIQWTESFPSTNWHLLTNVALTNTAEAFLTNSMTSTNHFYRSVSDP